MFTRNGRNDSVAGDFRDCVEVTSTAHLGFSNRNTRRNRHFFKSWFRPSQTPSHRLKMDHHNHGDSATMSIVTETASAAAAAATSMSGDHGGHGGMGGSGCKISMLWNWNTVDSCFISSSWKISSRNMFAGSCIGAVLLVVSLEMLRRAVKEYDRFLINKHLKAQTATARISPKKTSEDGSPGPAAPVCVGAISNGYRPAVLEQAVRALLHMLQFAVAYFVMLLAMYYNGYMIICIFIGAYIGSFIFHWEPLGAAMQTSASREATVCCG
ncbi:hypothetical protein VTK56DRAFT_6683 [Thermocarpiscus australiensis]